MADDYKHLLQEAIADAAAFVSAEFSGAQRGQTVPWRKVVLRPVLIRQKRYIQFSYFDDRKDISKNYSGAEIVEKLEKLLGEPFGSIALRTATMDYHVQFTKKGKAILHRHAVETPQPVSLDHDRRKNLLLPVDQPDSFLHMMGIMTANGTVKASMQGKFRQINEFLKLIDETGDLAPSSDSPLTIVDCGCGSAYLTFATYHYLTHVLGLPTHVTGIDSNRELIAKRAEQTQQLGWDNLAFEASRIIDFVPDVPPDMVLALHACDTATDEALAQAVTWGSRMIFSAPCCHHHLQAQLDAQTPPAIFAPVMRHGVFKERVGDVLTDTFRLLILAIMGYRAQIVEFVSTEHTGKNLMIRAIQSPGMDVEQAIGEYAALKAFWGVTPYLERLLRDELVALGAVSPDAVNDDGDGFAAGICHVREDDFAVSPSA